MELGPIFRAMRSNKARFVLIVLQVALTFAIVTNCVNLMQEAKADLKRTSGFDDDHLIAVRSTNFAEAFQDDAYVRAAELADLEALRAMPGIRAATSTFFRPWQGGGSSFEVKILDTEMESLRSQVYTVDPEVLDALGVDIVSGRGFAPEDFSDNPRASTYNVMISKGLAELAFGDQDAVGESFEGYGSSFRIVGVFDPFYNPYGWPIHEYAVLFSGPSAGNSGAHYLVRAEPGETDRVARDLEARLLAVNEGRNLGIETIAEIKTEFQAEDNILVNVLTVIIVLLIFVTALGIIGLTSFSVTERRRQIGTRRALGARKVDIVRYFLVENWLVTTLGIVVGVVLAYALNIALTTHLTADKLELGIVAFGVVLLWVVGQAVALGPALRGAQVPPAIATRNV